MPTQVELLAPAGSLEKGMMALRYGADAIYLGGKAFGLRAFAANFTLDEMAEMVSFAHAHGKKVYVTVNIFPHNSDVAALPEYLRSLEAIGVDALLISDLGVWSIARRTIPTMPLHVSTQANVVNYEAAKAWQDLGASRIVLARELSSAEIAEIHAKCSVELEAFVHGAMCISYSGRCLLSSYLTGRDGNRGSCAQVCRWEFTLHEATRAQEEYPICEDERGTYILNSKDLCLIDYLPQLLDSGVTSLKIEGRMKSVHYVATVVSAYRKAIDSYLASPATYAVKDEWRAELAKVSHRPYTTGFFCAKPDGNSQVYTTSSYEQTHDFVGIVLGSDGQRLYIEQRNNVAAGTQVEALTPQGQISEFTLKDLQDAEGNSISVANHAQMHFSVALPEGVELPAFSLLRRERHGGK